MSGGAAGPQPPAERLVAFQRFLRRHGLRSGPAELADLAAASRHCDWLDREGFRAAARTTLVKRYEDLARFEALFEAFWDGHAPRAGEDADTAAPADPGEGAGDAAPVLELLAGAGEESAPAESEAGAEATLVRLDDARDMAALTEMELAAIRPAAERLGRALARRRGRRFQPARRGSRPDPARLRREALRQGGQPARLHWRARRRDRLELLALCDVSGSMRPYARFFLHVMQAFARCRGRLRAAVFSTALHEITDAIARPGAIDAGPLAIPGAGAGTDIGAALEQFTRRFEAQLHPGRSCVLVFSDGLDCGDDARLAAAMAVLAERCERLVWLNPLLGRPGYAPMARGMRTALPYLDHFLPANSPASFAAAVARILAPGAPPAALGDYPSSF